MTKHSIHDKMRMDYIIKSNQLHTLLL